MKFVSSILLFISVLFSLEIYSQNYSGHDIAINESQMSYLIPESCDFSEKHGFDMRFSSFKEVSYKTYLFSSPSLEMKDIIKPVPRGTVIKAYKKYKELNCWAVKFENDWGFMTDDLLKKIEEYEEPIDAEDLDSPPQLLSRLSIKYPSWAKKEGVTGEVVLRILVSNTGAVEEIEIEKSIPMLDSTAIDAVERLRFKPAKKHGLPTDVWVRVPLNFEIKGT